jgi:hypothetical protein
MSRCGSQGEVRGSSGEARCEGKNFFFKAAVRATAQHEIAREKSCQEGRESGKKNGRLSS